MTLDTATLKPARSPLSLWAIVVGSFVDIALTLLGGVFLLPFTDDLVAQLVFGLAMTAVGGYVAAAMAGRRILTHGLAVGVLSTGVGILLTRIGGEVLAGYPWWYRILAVGLTIPAAVAGAWLRQRLSRPVSPSAVTRPGVYPNVWQTIGLAALAILVSTVMITAVGVPAFLSLSLRGQSSVPWWVVPAIFGGATSGYVLILVWATRRTRAPVREVYPIIKVPVGSVGPAVLTSIGLAVLLGELISVIQKIFPPPTVPADLMKLFDVTAESRWAAVAFIVVLGPLAEELLFRGVILRGLLSRFSVRKTIVVSALVFGAYHLNPFQFATATTLGVLLAWWRVQTGSLVLPFLGHALNNGLALAMTRLPWVNDRALTGVTGTFPYQPLWFDLLGLALLVIGIVQFARVIRAHRSEPVPVPASP